jgi:hypothetical protein
MTSIKFAVTLERFSLRPLRPFFAPFAVKGS